LAKALNGIRKALSLDTFATIALTDTLLNCRISTCAAKPGDANASGTYSLGDIIATVNFIFTKLGYPPCGNNNNTCWLSGLTCRGDWNGSGTVSLGDVIQGVNYIFAKPGGPWFPVPSGSCCIPYIP